MRLVAATCRVTAPVTQDQVVLAFWHEYNIAAAIAARRLRRCRTRQLQHPDLPRRGDDTDAARALGSGSSSCLPEGERAEAAHSRSSWRASAEGASLVVSPDGPFGPYRRAKPGALIVARASGLPVQPWAVASGRRSASPADGTASSCRCPFCRLRVDRGAADPGRPREPLRPLLAVLQAELTPSLRGRTPGWASTLRWLGRPRDSLP